MSLGVVPPGELLPPGEDCSEPVYGAPARWISENDREEAALQGSTVVTAAEVLATHLLEVLKRNFARLLTMKALRRLLEELSNLSDPVRAEANRRLIDELVPDKVPIELLLAVMRLLLDEQVSVRNLPLILEAISEARGTYSSPEAICEHVRQRLGFQLVSELRREDGSLPLLQLAPEWEEKFLAHQVDGGNGTEDIALPPEAFSKLAGGVAEKLSKVAESGISPALVTTSRRRRFLKTVLTAKGIGAPVLSFEEIGMDARPALLGVIAA